MIDATANTAGDDRPNVLYLVHRVPFPPDKGDRIRAYHILRYLSRRARVHLACLADEPVDDATITVLGELCDGLAIVPLRARTRWVRALGFLAAGRTATEGAFDSPRLRAMLGRWAGETRFQAVIASSSSMVPYLRMAELQDVPAVVDLVDVDSEKWLDYAAAGSGPKSWLYWIEGLRLRRLEHGLPGWARAVTLVSEDEADLFRRCVRPADVILAVTNGVDTGYFRPRPGVQERGCVFVGALDYAPNVDGIGWFCREAWPEIRRRHPGTTLSLVGRRPAPAACRLAALPGVELVGQVPDVRPWLAGAAVAVAPLRIARGIQNKVLEAMAMGKPVVASPHALSGLGVEPGTHALAASDGNQWADAVGALLDDDTLRRRIGAAGLRYVRDRHGWDACLAPFGTTLDQISGRDKIETTCPAAAPTPAAVSVSEKA